MQWIEMQIEIDGTIWMKFKMQTERISSSHNALRFITFVYKNINSFLGIYVLC